MKLWKGSGGGRGKGRDDDCRRCDDDLLLAELEWEKRKGSLWDSRRGSKSK